MIGFFLHQTHLSQLMPLRKVSFPFLSLAGVFGLVVQLEGAQRCFEIHCCPSTKTREGKERKERKGKSQKETHGEKKNQSNHPLSAHWAVRTHHNMSIAEANRIRG